MATSYQKQRDRAQQLLFAYGIFRLILATGLVVLAALPDTITDLFPATNVESVQLATIAYLILAILGMLLTVYEQLSKTPITVLLITDVLLLMLIMRYTGGVDSGISSLLLISVGIGALLLPLEQSLLLAAIATSSVVYTEMLPITKGSDRNLLQAALLGLGYFGETLLIQYISSRATTSERLAQAQADTILDLRHLNELIVQRMRTGIIVITNDGAIRLLNDAAKALLDIQEKRLFFLTKPIFELLKEWKDSAAGASYVFQASPNHPQVNINFARLQLSHDSDIIMFIEDTGKLKQQAQEMKLASLGRLTASIAHEIRNPLGAISHATQLLDESADLNVADKRLLEIVQNHSQRMNTIIETILTLSRRTSGAQEKVAIEVIIGQCLSEREIHTSRDQDNIMLALNEFFTVEVNVNQIKQVLHNLIDNGLRYSEKQSGHRTLIISSGQTEDTQQYFLDVLDEGAGVPKDQIKNLFEPFYTTENSGTGLGLYIAKELCEANRLRLQYLDNRTGGCFRILFSHSISQTELVS